MIKILRIIGRLNIGGPAQNAVLLSEGLSGGNFDTLLVAGLPEAHEGDMTYLAKENNVKLRIVPQLRRELDLINDIVAFWKIFQIVLKERPDIMHTHTAKAGTLGRLAGMFYNIVQIPTLNIKTRCRLVHTFHGHVLEGYFGKIKSFIFIRIERILAKFTDKIIVVSQKIKEDLFRLGVGREGEVAVIPLGLELDKFLAINSPDTAKAELNIGIIGRLAPIKNHRMFLEAVKILQGYPTKFFIIGDGELRKKLEDYARDSGIQNDIIFMGWQNDLEKVYQNLDVVVLTSLNEGTPVSLIEAMAASRPVIATDVGGIRDLIGDNERGILIKPKDARALADAIAGLTGNPSQRIELGNLGRSFVKDRFNKERLIKDMELLYNNLLKKEPGLCAC